MKCSSPGASAAIDRSGCLLGTAWWLLLAAGLRRDTAIRLYAGLARSGTRIRVDAQAVLACTRGSTLTNPADARDHQ